MSVANARAELHKLQSRRKDTDEARRAKHKERRTLLETARKKGRRDPQSEKRAAELDREISKLEAEAKDARHRIHDLCDRYHELTDAVDEAARILERERKQRKEKHEDGADAAIEWALKQVGVHESPAGSNWGHPVQDWILRAGYGGPVPWCGCFAHEIAVVIGGANVSTQLGYAGNIVADARAGRNGLTAVPAGEARKGDIGSLWNAEHVVTLRGSVSGISVPTIEGNTTTTDGSESDGGIVAAKFRTISDFDVFARPAY